MASKGSKNNILNRGAKARVKQYNGKDVVPAKFMGKQGKFVAAQFKNGGLVMDKNGAPVPYDKIQ